MEDNELITQLVIMLLYHFRQIIEDNIKERRRRKAIALSLGEMKGYGLTKLYHVLSMHG